MDKKIEVAPVASAPQPIIGQLMDQISALPVLWGLGEPGALLRNSDVFRVLVAAGRAIEAAPAPSAAAPQVVAANGAPKLESIDCEEFRKLADAYHCVSSQENVEPAYDAMYQYVDSEIERQARAALAAAPVQAAMPELPEPWITDMSRGVQEESRRHYSADQIIDHGTACFAAGRASVAPVQAQEPVLWYDASAEPHQDHGVLIDDARQIAILGATTGPFGRYTTALYAHRAPVQPVAVPDGWRFVPIEPTPAMIAAAQFHTEHDGREDDGDGEVQPGSQQFYVARGRALAVYFEMLAAAPAAPSAPATVTDTGAAQADGKDAERFRWLCADLESLEMRRHRNGLLESMCARSYSVICTDIDAARAIAAKAAA